MANMVIESLGVYLPPKMVSTDEVLQACTREVTFPLEFITGIRSRRMAGETEFSLDLAMKSYLECAQRAGAGEGEFVCRACGAHSSDWRDRCQECGSWNSVELDFAEEAFSADELGLRLAPAQSIYDRNWHPRD